MHENQRVKTVQVIAPVAIKDNAGWTTVEIDTLGFDDCVVKFMLGAMDIKMVALKMQESETTGSGQTDITGADYSSPDLLPTATDDNGIWAWYIDCRNHGRYLTLVATAGDGAAGTFACAWADLSRGRSDPSTAVLRGNTKEIFVSP